MRGQLLAWYQEHQRPLPWRGTTDPYAILVSEIMLQQKPLHLVVTREVQAERALLH
jgi:A/G-specific adenine glycosylase